MRLLSLCAAGLAVAFGAGWVAAGATAPGRFVDTAGRPYALVAGTIRQEAPGVGWHLVGGAHTSVNLTVRQVTDRGIVLGFRARTRRVISVVCGPDETFTQLGYGCGASVGLDSMTIRLSHHGRPVAPADVYAVLGNFWILGFLDGE